MGCGAYASRQSGKGASGAHASAARIRANRVAAMRLGIIRAILCRIAAPCAVTKRLAAALAGVAGADAPHFWLRYVTKIASFGGTTIGRNGDGRHAT